MKGNELMNGKDTIKIVLACVAFGWMCWSVSNTCYAQTPSAKPSGLSPELQEVVKLSKQKMSDEVIVNYIRSSGKSYKLSADNIIYLSSEGVSQGVIKALQTESAGASQVSVVQEYDDYVFELKECRVVDRQDKQVNDGRPHKQLVCKVLVTNKKGDRKLSMYAEKDGEHTRVIDDTGTEYDCGGGALGTSSIIWRGWGGVDPAGLVVPSGVPVKAILLFGVDPRVGSGYFSPEAKSLGVLDIIFISDEMAGQKPFHIQFKHVSIPL